MNVDIGIIGGTGISPRFEALGGRTIFVQSEFGMLRGSLIDYKGIKIITVLRHAKGHKLPPHHINFLAMSAGLKKLNVKAVYSACAVGSMRKDWEAGTVALCSDFIDLTYRNITLHDKQVQHIDFTEPYNHALRQTIIDSSKELNIPIQEKCVYVGLNGPRYETPKEVQILGTLGGDVAGMTGSTEAIAMREAGLPYACISMVTNLGAGLEGKELTHEDVIEQMNLNGQKAVQLILSGAEKFMLQQAKS